MHTPEIIAFGSLAVSALAGFPMVFFAARASSQANQDRIAAAREEGARPYREQASQLQQRVYDLEDQLRNKGSQS